MMRSLCSIVLALCILLASGCGPLRNMGAGREVVREAVSVPAGELDYIRCGPEDGRRVILIHGIGRHSIIWNALLKDPPDTVEMLAVDRPGYGPAPLDWPQPSVPDQATLISSLLEPGAVLVGYSYGGLIALQMAADHPEQVAGVLLVSSAFDPEIFTRNSFGSPVWTWGPIPWIIGKKWRQANAELYNLHGESRRIEQVLARVQCPVFLLHGNQDRAVPRSGVSHYRRFLREGIPVEVRIVPTAPHWIPFSQPWEVRRSLDRLLAVVATREGLESPR